MNKAIAAMCVGLLLAAAADPASARAKHHRHGDPAWAPRNTIHFGGPPRNWNDIKISHPGWYRGGSDAYMRERHDPTTSSGG